MGDPVDKNFGTGSVSLGEASGGPQPMSDPAPREATSKFTATRWNDIFFAILWWAFTLAGAGLGIYGYTQAKDDVDKVYACLLSVRDQLL